MLQTELDRERTAHFVRTTWFTRDPDGFYHRESQALLTCEFVERWHLEEHSFLTPAMRVTIDGSWHASMLTGALDQRGCRFEDIVILTNLETADMLAAITPDNRLPAPRRLLMHISDLGQAKRCPQIIRLVQMIDAVEDAKTRFLADPEKERGWLKEVLPELDRYVDALWRLSESMTIRPIWEAVKFNCTTLCQTLDQWRQREALLARLRERGLATPAPATPKRTRGRR